MVDANGAYRLSDSALFEAMDGWSLMMIEQPLAPDDVVDHAKLQARVKTPLCLDESIQNPYFARVAAELGACRIINIKQGRVGGLSAAKEIHDVAQANRMGVWCGGMLETGIGRAVNVALASLPNFVYPNDISASKRYWERDIIDPPFSLNPDGTLDVPSAAGLGVTVDERALAHVTLAREVIRL
jgi:O-succinylbenzoate synthase